MHVKQQQIIAVIILQMEREESSTTSNQVVKSSTRDVVLLQEKILKAVVRRIMSKSHVELHVKTTKNIYDAFAGGEFRTPIASSFFSDQCLCVTLNKPATG